ncbi:hypothetical protein GCM10009069_17410 [Algimonas arctica]|uniref:Uncharacterized protein n=1 Tax=Algimonas arctica TaxID=1479486 RepID=A0A8J3CRH5_9PROT|nr:hypothetical protein [Algimonas arctica]GHA94931.1 hypothetical protein GCM10009069_17410 [Algimonas arctica]
MATYSIKSLCLVLTLATAVLPAQALAGPALNTANAPVEMWDVMTPRAEVKLAVSHIDVSSTQGFDAPGTVIPMTIKIPSRADFSGPKQAEMWDVISEDHSAKAVGVSHMDIQPGQSLDRPAFDYSATLASDLRTNVPSESILTVGTPDA